VRRGHLVDGLGQLEDPVRQVQEPLVLPFLDLDDLPPVVGQRLPFLVDSG